MARNNSRRDPTDLTLTIGLCADPGWYAAQWEAAGPEAKPGLARRAGAWLGAAGRRLAGAATRLRPARMAPIVPVRAS